MGSSNEELINAINNYQERLERYNLNKSEDKMLYILQKLSKLPIKTSHLETTGVGRTVNALKKLNGKVGDAAKNVVALWKKMVLEEEKIVQEAMENEDDDDDDDDDANSVYSSENESQDLQIEEGKENINRLSENETDNEDYDKRDVPTKYKSHDYLENKNSKFKDERNYKNQHSSTSSSSDEAISNKHYRKRTHSTESSSDERSKHKSKKSKKEKENSSGNHRDRSSKHEKDKKHKKQYKQSSSKSKHISNSSEPKHKSKKETEQSNYKLDKQSKLEDKTEKDKKSSHSSKHSSSSSSHSSKKESKDRKDNDNQNSKREIYKSKSPVKKVKESSKEEKKKSKDSSSQLKEKRSSSDNGEKKTKKEKVKSVSKEKIINGIGSESGASFAEALGMCGPVSSHSNKKKPNSDKKSSKPVEYKHVDVFKSSSKSKHEDSPSSSSSKQVPDLLLEEPAEQINICLSSLLPEISPNYKPTPINLDSQLKRISNDDEALSRVMSNKNQRTKVYSGNKTVGKVESLFQICVRVLQDNIDALEYTGGVPYIILKPILERSTPDQLFNMEHHNPYLIEDTDELWQLHCQKDFRTKKREELESWREMYMRCLDEREARLNFITANIKQSQDKSEPVRTTKMAYIDSAFVKPPRNIARKQAKNGTLTTDRKISPSQKLSTLAKSGDAEKIAVPNPGSRAVERSSNTSSHVIKPKKAPLMAKTLSFLKNRFKR